MPNCFYGLFIISCTSNLLSTVVEFPTDCVSRIDTDSE